MQPPTHEVAGPGRVRTCEYLPQPAKLNMMPMRQNGEPGVMLIIDNGGGSAAAWLTASELQVVIDKMTELTTGLVVARQPQPLGVVK
jgi:hypothetical protein